MRNERSGCLKLQLSRGGAMLARWSQGPEITDSNRTRAPLIDKNIETLRKEQVYIMKRKQNTRIHTTKYASVAQR